ncbi:MAG: hypothetical protein ACKVT1_20750 [Dehalococcoidia bacterium]
MTRSTVLVFLILGAAVLGATCGGGDDTSLRDRATTRTPDTASPAPGEASPSAEATAASTTTAATSPAAATQQATAAAAGANTPPPAAATSPAVSKEVCVVQVTGSQQGSITDRANRSAVETDYWVYTADRINQAGGPIGALLLLHCGGRLANGEVTVTIAPSPDSTYADVPFGPRSYVIAPGGLFDDDPARGQFSALLTVGTTIYEVNEPGRLTIDSFTTGLISGSFSFNATEASLDDDENLKKVSVQGTFDIPCAGSQCKK